MCTTANDLIFIETKRMEESFLGERARGLKFRSLKCALCQKLVQNTFVVVFECKRNYFNHSIHLECVAAVMKREQAKSQKTTEAKMRCPVCYKSNYDISGIQSERKLFKLDQSTRPRENSKNSSNSSGNGNGVAQMRDAQLKVLQRQEIQEINRGKKLKSFEASVYDAVLRKSDFL